MIVDSHCHLGMLDLEPYHGNLSELLQAARDVGVERFLCIGTELEDSPQVVKIAEKYPDVYATIGVHPSESTAFYCDEETLINLANHPKVVAIGETGLDYYYNKDNHDQQREMFARHITVAKQLKKPIIVHTRDAEQDTKDILKDNAVSEVGGVMHCFTGTWDLASYAIDLGMYISISGIVTFKKATNVVEVAKKTPIERLLIETDSPYLAPVPYRGKKNEPKYVIEVAKKIAEIKGMTYQEVADITTRNFFECFHISE